MASEFDLHYALLNSEQRRAVDHVDGPMLVLAGAGTGKTQIIALRIAKLLANQDLAARNILCLTFTESGVQAMRERLVKMLGPAAYQVRVYTFHGFCNEVITEHPEVFIAQSALEPITDLDRITLVQEIIQTLPADSSLKPFGAPDFYISEILRAIQTLKRENVSPEQLDALADQDTMQPKQTPKQKELVGVYRQYQQALHTTQRYDYEDMILYVIRAFQDQPDLLADYQERYLQILVDEFQDTNGAQNEVLTLLGANQADPNIFVVGDDRQSVYRFQGAALENILSFQQRYGKTAQIVSLQENYRSQQTILDAATGLINQNQRSLAHYIPSLKTDLRSARKLEPQPIELAALSSPATELFWLSQRVKQLLANGVPAHEVAILCRTNSDAALVTDYLHQVKVPCHLAAGTSVLADPLIQQLIQLFSYLGFGGNDEQLFSISQSAWLKLPLATVAITAHQANSSHRFLWEVYQASPDPIINAFATNLLRWRQAMHTQLCTEWFTTVVNESGWLEYVLQTDQSVEHLNRLASLFQAIVQLTRARQTITIKDVLEYLQLLQKHDLNIMEEPLATRRQAVPVFTAHRAKGLEFSHVFMVRCLDKHWGNVPDRAKLKLPEGIVQFDLGVDHQDKRELLNEDERRLFYVAMTRAKERLYLSYAAQSESGRATLPCQFIAELPAETVVPATDTDLVETEPEERLKQSVAPVHTQLDTEQVKDYVRNLLADYRMSATHLNDYLECPLIFLYQDVLRVPRSISRAVGFGIAVHNALRFASAEQPKPKALLKVFEAELGKQLLSKADYIDSLAFGQKILKQYYADHEAFVAKNLFPEKDFRPYQVVVDGVPLTGKIDAIHLLDDEAKTVHVVDYKTGNPDNKSSDLAKGGPYHRQLLFYKLLCDQAEEFGYSAVSGEIHFIQPSKQKGKYAHRQYEFTDEDVAALRQQLVTVYHHIQQLDFINPPAEQLCGECQWCLWKK